MAINFTDYSDPGRWSQNKYEGITNFLPNILAGYKAARAPQEMDADLSLKRAQTQHYMQPKEYAMSDFSKIIQERANLANQNPNDPRLALYDQLIQRKAEGTPGLELSVGANGEVTVTQGNRPGTKGPQIVKDANGNDVIVTPQSAAATERQQQRSTAKAELSRLQDIRQPYIGKGSIKRLNSDVQNYQTSQDPAQKAELFERLVQANLADLLVPDVATLTLQSIGKSNVTDTDIKHQREVLKRGWPESGKFEFNNLPPEIIQESVKRYNQINHELGDIASRQYATGFPIDANKINTQRQQQQIPAQQMTREQRDAEIARILEKRNGR